MPSQDEFADMALEAIETCGVSVSVTPRQRGATKDPVTRKPIDSVLDPFDAVALRSPTDRRPQGGRAYDKHERFSFSAAAIAAAGSGIEDYYSITAADGTWEIFSTGSRCNGLVIDAFAGRKAARS